MYFYFSDVFVFSFPWVYYFFWNKNAVETSAPTKPEFAFAWGQRSHGSTEAALGSQLTSNWQILALLSSLQPSTQATLPPSWNSFLGLDGTTPFCFSSCLSICPTQSLWLLCLLPSTSTMSPNLLPLHPRPADLIPSYSFKCHIYSCSSQVTSPNVFPELSLIDPMLCLTSLFTCTSNMHLKHHVPNRTCHSFSPSLGPALALSLSFLWMILSSTVFGCLGQNSRSYPFF